MDYMKDIYEGVYREIQFMKDIYEGIYREIHDD